MAVTANIAAIAVQVEYAPTAFPAPVFGFERRREKQGRFGN